MQSNYPIIIVLILPLITLIQSSPHQQFHQSYIDGKLTHPNPQIKAELLSIFFQIKNIIFYWLWNVVPPIVIGIIIVVIVYVCNLMVKNNIVFDHSKAKRIGKICLITISVFCMANIAVIALYRIPQILRLRTICLTTVQQLSKMPQIYNSSSQLSFSEQYEHFRQQQYKLQIKMNILRYRLRSINTYVQGKLIYIVQNGDQILSMLSDDKQSEEYRQKLGDQINQLREIVNQPHRYSSYREFWQLTNPHFYQLVFEIINGFNLASSFTKQYQFQWRVVNHYHQQIKSTITIIALTLVTLFFSIFIFSIMTTINLIGHLTPKIPQKLHNLTHPSKLQILWFIIIVIVLGIVLFNATKMSHDLTRMIDRQIALEQSSLSIQRRDIAIPLSSTTAHRMQTVVYRPTRESIKERYEAIADLAERRLRIFNSIKQTPQFYSILFQEAKLFTDNQEISAKIETLSLNHFVVHPPIKQKKQLLISLKQFIEILHDQQTQKIDYGALPMHLINSQSNIYGQLQSSIFLINSSIVGMFRSILLLLPIALSYLYNDRREYHSMENKAPSGGKQEYIQLNNLSEEERLG